MPQDHPILEPQTPPADNYAAGAGPGPVSSPAKKLLAKVLVLLFVVAVVVVECLIAYFFFPSASDTAAMASAALSADAKEAEQAAPAKPRHKSGKEGKQQEPGRIANDQIEVDLGEYSVTAAHPDANTTLQISFRLYGTVGSADEAEFQALKAENEHRMREQVLVTVRSAKMADLADAGLGLLKRAILEKTNAVLGKPILRAIVFSDFVFIEQ